MKATDILRHEHQAILLVIFQIEKEVASIEKTGKMHAQTVRKMADFLENFVDRCHHGKEEKHLFVTIHRRGMSMETGSLAVALHEHERCRTYLCAVVEAVAGKGPYGAAAVQKVKTNLAAYAKLLRVHIYKEDKVLFVMADRILDIHDQKLLCEAFDMVEAAAMADGPLMLKWVKKDDDSEIKVALVKELPVHLKGSETKNSKDSDFLETLVSLHRAGESAPFVGVRAGQVDPIVAMADKALDDGFVDEMIKMINGQAAAAIRERFNKALEAKTNKDENDEAGHSFVQNYVTYMHYVKSIHSAILSAGGHHSAETIEAEHKDT